MSGGHFEYRQYIFHEFSEEIRRLIHSNKTSRDEWSEPRNYPDDVIQEFEKAIKSIDIAGVYAQRIDYLVSGDDSEEFFLRRLKKELEELK